MRMYNRTFLWTTLYFSADSMNTPLEETLSSIAHLADWKYSTRDQIFVGIRLLLFSFILQVLTIGLFIVIWGQFSAVIRRAMPEGFAIMLLFGLLILISHHFGRRARPYFAWQELQLMRRDPRRVILYLRPFSTDSQTLPSSFTVDYGRKPESYVWNFWQRWSIEDELAGRLRRIGPLIAIGQPGEVLPSVGACRVYVTDENWKKVVTMLLPMVSMVFLRVSNTSGVDWELEEVIRNGTVPYGLILVDQFGQPLSKSDYHSLRCRLVWRAGIALPEDAWHAWYLAYIPGRDKIIIDARKASGQRNEFRRSTDKLISQIPELSILSNRILDPYMSRLFVLFRYILPFITVYPLFLMFVIDLVSDMF